MARYKEEQERKAYRVYVAEVLRLTGENTAKMAGGSYINKKFTDIMNPPEEETRTPQEVTDYMLNKLRGGK